MGAPRLHLVSTLSLHALSATLRPRTLSPHLVSTLCPRTLSPHFVPLRFVSTLCPYALSKRKMERQKRIRPGQSSSSSRPPALPELPTGIDGYRQVATGAMAIYECCPSVARTFLSAPGCAGRHACPALPRTACLFRPSRLPCNSPDTRPPSTPADPRQPPSKLIAGGIDHHHHPACDTRSNLRTYA